MAQHAEERRDRPPSYTEPNQSMVVTPAPTIYPGVVPQQVVYMTQAQGGMVPQQSYIIQNVQAAQQDSCCGGKSSGYKWSVGFTTSIIHLIVSVICIVVSVFLYVFPYDVEEYYYVGIGSSIGGVLLFIPAGILGVLSKSKNSCVIIGYLVMAILSAIHAACVVIVEASAAAFSSYSYRCTVVPPAVQDYVFVDENIGEHVPNPPYSCSNELVSSVFAMHIILAVTCFVEFIAAVVSAAYCCGGLRCCCGNTPNEPQTMTTMYCAPTGQPQATPVQMEGHAACGGAEPLVQKA